MRSSASSCSRESDVVNHDPDLIGRSYVLADDALALVPERNEPGQGALMMILHRGRGQMSLPSRNGLLFASTPQIKMERCKCFGA